MPSLTNYSKTSQHLAGLEEISCMADVNQFIDSSVSKDIQKSCQACLLKVEFCLTLEVFCFVLSFVPFA